MLWRHLLGYLPLNLAQALAGFGGIFLLTRLLTPAEYGLYSLVYSIVVITHSLLFTWIEAAVARTYARAEADQRLADHLATAFRYLGLFVAVFAVLGVGLVWLLPVSAEFKTVLGFGIGSMLTKTFLDLSLEARKAAREVRRYSLTQMLNVTGAFILGILFVVFTDLKGAGPFAGVTVAAMATMLFDLPNMLRRMRGGKSNARELKSFFRYGMPLSLSLILGYILQAGDRFVISALLGNDQVGVYAAGYGTANRSLDVLFVWAGMAASPILISALELGNRDKAKAMARKAFEAMAFLTFPAAAGIALVATPLANVMTGPEFRAGAAQIIPWIALAGLMNGLTTYYLLASFTLSRRTGIMALVTAIPAILNIAMNFVLLPKMGLMGAVVSTLVAYAVGMTLTAFLGRKSFPLPLPWIEVLRTVFACTLMALAVLALPLPAGMPDLLRLSLMASVGAIVYGLVAVALNLADCRDLIAGRLRHEQDAAMEIKG